MLQAEQRAGEMLETVRQFKNWLRKPVLLADLGITKNNLTNGRKHGAATERTARALVGVVVLVSQTERSRTVVWANPAHRSPPGAAAPPVSGCGL